MKKRSRQADPSEHVRAGVEYANSIQAARVIVVCEAAHRVSWLQGIKEWTTLHDPHCYAVVSSRYGISDIAEWTVISYELAHNQAILRGLVKQRFDLLLTTSALVHLVLELKLDGRLLTDACGDDRLLTDACGEVILCDRISAESVIPREPDQW